MSKLSVLELWMKSQLNHGGIDSYSIIIITVHVCTAHNPTVNEVALLSASALDIWRQELYVA